MSSNENSRDLYVKIAYFTSLAGISLLFGFSATLNKFKKNTPEAILHEQGVALARNALFRGTLYAVCGFGLVASLSYQAFGKDLIAEFRRKHAARDDPGDVLDEIGLKLD